MEEMQRCVDYIESRFTEIGYEPRAQEFRAQGEVFRNIEVELRGEGRPEEIVVVGAHYDTVEGSPGANDNTSGVAAVISLARVFSGKRASRSIRFVAFANEEQPFFMTPEMGSYAYADRCRRRGEDIVAMLSLETIGYYTEEPNSQSYPFPLNLFYPATGDFVAFVGNHSSRNLVRRCVKIFRESTPFPSEGAAVWEHIPGIAWSDQWAFWRNGYPAVMVTDTAPYRYPYYHTPQDTPERLTYGALARVVGGLETIVRRLSSSLI
jgi:Zn-dependent M28 family amino/carboxypeptidase